MAKGHVVERILSEARVEALRESFPKLFAGRFDTGVYPDEWCWREGMSLPDVTRHMANAWKADLTVARLALSADVGRAASALAGWSGARLGQDTIWWKAPRTKPVAHHQDSSFMDFLDPARTVTCWVTLDDTHRDAGTLEYAPGSRLWPLTPLPEAFHGQDDYRAQMKAAARAAGVAEPDPFFFEIPAGSCVFHAGEIWRGSGPNTTGDRMRRSIGIHLVPEEARFSNRPGGYIYRRYQRMPATLQRCSFYLVPILFQIPLSSSRCAAMLIRRPSTSLLRDGAAIACLADLRPVGARPCTPKVPAVIARRWHAKPCGVRIGICPTPAIVAAPVRAPRSRPPMAPNAILRHPRGICPKGAPAAPAHRGAPPP